jgi:hypothetical protein
MLLNKSLSQSGPRGPTADDPSSERNIGRCVLQSLFLRIIFNPAASHGCATAQDSCQSRPSRLLSVATDGCGMYLRDPKALARALDAIVSCASPRRSSVSARSRRFLSGSQRHHPFDRGTGMSMTYLLTPSARSAATGRLPNSTMMARIARTQELEHGDVAQHLCSEIESKSD